MTSVEPAGAATYPGVMAGHDDAPRAPVRLDAAHARRNREPILEVLKTCLPARGLVVEIGSGTGQHVAWFAPHFPHLAWQPSELDVDLHDSIRAWAADANVDTVREPLAIDVSDGDWPDALGHEEVVAVLSMNMIHIAPWAACQGLMRGAGKLLGPGGLLYLYGPFKRGGVHTAESNSRFDATLRRWDAAWGVRDLEAVTELAAAAGFATPQVVAMPANNLSVIYRRS